MFLFMTTTGGVIKKVDMDAFDAVRKSGMVAIKLKTNDELGCFVRWGLESLRLHGT